MMTTKDREAEALLEELKATTGGDHTEINADLAELHLNSTCGIHVEKIYLIRENGLIDYLAISYGNPEEHETPQKEAKTPLNFDGGNVWGNILYGREDI
jgi:hypothetical protein